MNFVDTLDEAWRTIAEVSAEVGPTEAPKMDFPLKVMLDIHHEACARVKGRLPWNCDLADLEKFGPEAIEYLEGLSRKHGQMKLFAQTIRLMRAFEGYLRTAKPSGAIRPEVERRLVVRHDELIAGFEKELARLYSAMYPYVRGECMEVIFKGMSPEAEAQMTAAFRRARGRGGRGRQINERQRKDHNEVVTEMRRLKEIAERERRTLTWLEIVERLKRSPVYAKKLIGVADVSWVSYAKRRI